MSAQRATHVNTCVMFMQSCPVETCSGSCTQCPVVLRMLVWKQVPSKCLEGKDCKRVENM